ncbi:MAG: phosphoglucosamine mutase [Planctomycetota bacterium]|nr:phosphoglucosamine mutase [Planctomycetota bacterium]
MSIFGTDGIRGRAGEGLLARDSVEAIGRSLASVLHDREDFPLDIGTERGNAVYIGRDTRGSGPQLLGQLSEGFLSAGLDVCDLGVLPTPGIAELARSSAECCLAMVLSASHNPAQDNGIKLISAAGSKVSDQLEAEVSRRFDSGASAGASQRGALRDVSEGAFEHYVNFLVSTSGGGLEGRKVFIDAANGAASAVAPEVFRRLGMEVRSIGDQPDGKNINDGCGSLYPGKLSEALRESGFDIGFCFDGDADRLIPLSASGAVFDGDLVLALAGRQYQAAGKLPANAVVATVMSNIGLERSLGECGIELIRTSVGDRNVYSQMREGGHPVGGEQSGHIIFMEHSSTGDGVLASLQMLDFLLDRDLDLDRAARVMTSYPQVLKNVKVRERVPLEEVGALQEIVEKVESQLADEGRVLLRYSGTEPLLRVMLEGPQQQLVEQLCDEICGVVRDAMGEQ